MSDIFSKPFRPDQCCEACVFGSGQHAEWCEPTNRIAKRKGYDSDKDWLQRALRLFVDETQEVTSSG